MIKRRPVYGTQYCYCWDGDKGRFLRIFRNSACLYYNHWSFSISRLSRHNWYKCHFDWALKCRRLRLGKAEIAYHTDLLTLYSLL